MESVVLHSESLLFHVTRTRVLLVNLTIASELINI